VYEEREDITRPPPELEETFHQLAQQLDVPPPPDYVARVRELLVSGPAGSQPSAWRRPFGPTSPWRRVAMATIVLLLALTVVLSVPATRAAVADLFGFSSVSVRTVPSTAASPRATMDARLDLGEPATLDEARRQVAFAVSVPSAPGLGSPDAVYVRRARGLESVSLVYRPSTGLPAVDDASVGLLVSEYSGTAEPYFEKLIDAGEPVTQVTVDGQWPGLYFSSPHQILVRSPDGLVHEDGPRLAAPTLVWVRDGVTYRLEAAVDLEQALAVASSMQVTELNR
jgi:hypothetical protein